MSGPDRPGREHPSAQHAGRTVRPALELVPAQEGPALACVRELFLEHQRSLDVDLCFQNFATELAALPGDYAAPSGRLYLGLSNGEPACCVALRRLDAATAEMKRLYVRPAFRGQGYGGVLARTVIADATMRQAVAEGATVGMAVADMPYGDRQGGIRDPHGNLWWISRRLVHAPCSA